MNDPWNVKSVRTSSQYVSCMKINGVPVLPPVLSDDCRKEMQYYMILAKQVEKRLETLKKMACYEMASPTNSDTDLTSSINSNPCLDLHDSISCKTLIEESSSPDDINDLFEENNQDTNSHENERQAREKNFDLPERDGSSISPKRTTKLSSQKVNNLMDFTINIGSSVMGNNLTFNAEGVSSRLSNKSFTGSLLDIHTENLKEAQSKIPLTRQSSYTLLNPSPALMAHLRVFSNQTGVDMMSISMSDTLSQSTSTDKKRKSWDLETAKHTWSNMALELNHKNIFRKSVSRISTKARIEAPDKLCHSTPSRTLQKNSPPEQTSQYSKTVSKSAKSSITKTPINTSISANYNINSDLSLKRSPTKCATPVSVVAKPVSEVTFISDSEDPASKVKELYDKIKQQQKMQITNLIEKQKREQLLLQQVFEEQNNLFYSQLNNVCPKSPLEVKQAWGESDKKSEPVSLSQLINKNSISPNDSPSSALSKYISQCDEVLRKSRDITDSLKKQSRNCSTPIRDQIINNQVTSSSQAHSPALQTIRSQSTSSTKRRINYESLSTDREFEPLLTDRTNDTMADLNVTFPTDNSCNDPCFSPNNTIKQCCPSKITQSKVSLVNNIQARCNTKSNRREREAATTIVAYAKGYLVRRLMRTERVEGIVQTIKDVLICALQLHQDREGIRGADVDLHRRLIQQITAACYSLHDTFVSSSPAERCAMIATDRARKSAQEARVTSPSSAKITRHLMTKDLSGVLRTSMSSPYETSSSTKFKYPKQTVRQ